MSGPAPGAAPAATAAPAAAGPAAAGPANAQALIAQHAAQTQGGAAGDAAIVARVENSIKHSPMGWLQAQLGEVSSRASSEGSEVNGKVAESRDIIAQNRTQAPADAGPPPAPGVAAHPAVPHPAAPAGATAAPHPAGGGTPAPAMPAPAVSAQRSAPSGSAGAIPAPLAGQLAGAGNDAQLDGLLNAYSPKGTEAPASLGRIKQMGDVARGFSGQLETYVAGGNAVEGAIAGFTNVFGAGKEASAVWRNNPYRQMHGTLGGIMTGMSAVKNVAGTVGSICGKIGLILTIVGLLGMIFPPVGAAVSGVARILNVISVICDAIGLVLSAILTGLNGVVLAQQIASGASAEEKAATADLMMSESQDAAGGLVNLATVFGGKFMKGLLGSSKGVIGSLMRRAKAVIGRVASKLGGNVLSFGKRIWRKMGFGGAMDERVGGQWVEKPGMMTRIANSRVVNAVSRTPEHLQNFQNKLMARYGNTGWAKSLDRWGARTSAAASRFDLEERIGGAGERAGAAINRMGGGGAWGRRFNATTDSVERETREAATRAAARDAGHLEATRWRNTIATRRATREAGSVGVQAGEAFAQRQGARVMRDEEANLAREERVALRNERDAERRELREKQQTEHDRDAYGHDEPGFRDRTHTRLEDARARRQRLETKHAPDLERKEKLEAMPTRTRAQEQELTRLNQRLRKLEDARHTNIAREEELSRLTGNGAEGQRNMEGWGDLYFNARSHYNHYSDVSDGIDRAKRPGQGKEYNAKHQTVGRNAEGVDQTVEESRTDAARERQHGLSEFVAQGPRASGLGGRVRGMLSNVGRAQPARRPAPGAAPPAGVTAPREGAAAPAPQEGAATAPVAAAAQEGVQAAVATAPGHEAAGPAPAAAPAHEEGAADDGGGADALPYWPALLPQFESATGDFTYMRKVAVEFKKAQIEGKQKAVDTLAVYGRFKEYSALRKAQAAQHAQASQQTGRETQQNQDHAGASSQSAGQGEAKQGQARGAANDRAATELPEPEESGFWGRLLGGLKRWAKNKAAALFGWIQDKIASVILQGLCGVSMGDLREYTGALRRQQSAAHGVAEGASETAGQVQQKQVQLGADANKESQEAATAIGECDQNILDADAFMADITTFEQQLAEEKAHAQQFIAQVHAAAHAEQEKARRAAAQCAADDAAHAQQQQQQAAAGGGQPAAAAPVAAPVAAAPVPAHDEEEGAAPAQDESATGEIHAAIDFVASQSESLVQQLETRGEDYTTQLASGLTRKNGRDANGVDLRTPAKRGTKHIVEEFKTAALSTKHELEHFHQMSIDPSSARRIADSVISAAEHIDEIFEESQHALDDLFARTYAAIRKGDAEAAAPAPAAAPTAAPAAAPPPQEHPVVTAPPPPVVAAPAPAPAPRAPAPAPTPAPDRDDDGDFDQIQRSFSRDDAPAAAAPALFKEVPGQTPVDAGGIATAGGVAGELPHAAAMQSAFGTDFAGVEVRTGASAEMGAMGAQAVTQGNRVTFASNNPDKALVAHELTHVVQGANAGGTAAATPIAAGHREGLESEANSVGARVAAGHAAGPIHGSTEGEGLRDDAPGAADVFPAAATVTAAGDKFTLVFKRGPEKGDLAAELKYEGEGKADAAFMRGNVLLMSHGLVDPKRKVNLKITAVEATKISFDLYGDGLTTGEFTDKVEPQGADRSHTMTLKLAGDRFGSTSWVTVSGGAAVAKPGAPGGGVATATFTAVDNFKLTARRFGDTKDAQVTLESAGSIPNPQTIQVPVTGDISKGVVIKILKNDGRNIAIDLDGDGKADLTFVHTIKHREENSAQGREHRFRRFDADGVLVGDRDYGMLYFEAGKPLTIPKEQDESLAAPDTAKDAPVTAAPQEGDGLGEIPIAKQNVSGTVEMRIDGDGDRTKELVVRFKGIPGPGASNAKGQMQIDLIQVSTGKAVSHTFDTTNDAIKAMKPWMTDVADGKNPTKIQVASAVYTDYGKSYDLAIAPPRIDTGTKARTYNVTFSGGAFDYVLPGEAAPQNELVKGVSGSPNIGNVAHYEVTLGEMNDKFWVMLENQPDGKSVFSVAALNPDGPVACRGMALTGDVKSFARVNTGATSFGIDTNGDGVADIQIFDAISQPPGLTSNKPIFVERDHVVTVSGAAVGGDKKLNFIVRNGKFQPGNFTNFDGSRDKEAASGAAAVNVLGNQADESRSVDGKGVAKDGDVNALLSRVNGMLGASRLKAQQAGLISGGMFDAWKGLAENLIMLGPQIGAGKVDSALQNTAAGNAAAFYKELADATRGTEDISGDEGSTTTTNKYTGTSTLTALFVNDSSGPGLRLEGEIKGGKWAEATRDFETLVHGLDKWIAFKIAKAKPGSDEAKQQAYYAGMAEQLDAVKAKPGVMRVSAVFTPDKSYNQNLKQYQDIPLMMFAWKEDGKWWLKDVTNPSGDGFLDRVDAKDGSTQPPNELLQQLDYAKHFPKGVLHYQIPGGAGGQIVTTERKHWYEFLQWVGLGLAVVGISLATFGTGTVAATAAAVCFAASGIAGAVAAGGDLYERAKHGDLQPAAVVMDLAQIVAGVFSAGAVISGRIVAAAASADAAAGGAWTGAAARIAAVSQKAYIPCLATATAADTVNLMALSAEIVSNIEKIKAGEGSDADKQRAIVMLLAQGLAMGGITILSIKGSMPEITSGRPTIVIEIQNGIPLARTTNPAGNWRRQLEERLSPEARVRMNAETSGKPPGELFERFHGDMDAAIKAYAKPTDAAGPKSPQTCETFVPGFPKDGNYGAQKAWLMNEAHWTPERQALHETLLQKAVADAQTFADKLKATVSEPTLFAMRGNTAAGKTRAVTGNVDEMKGAMADTAGLQYRSVNPDNFKVDLIKATPGATSSDVHFESSVLTDMLEARLRGLKTSGGKDTASILIDKRLASIAEVEKYAKMAKETGRKFVLYDVDAPLESSLVGVLERRPGGSDPLPPYEIVASGFQSVRSDRAGVIATFEAEGLGTYKLFGTRADGQRVPVATIENGKRTVIDDVLFKAALDPGMLAKQLETKQIDGAAIDLITSGLTGDRAQMIGAMLRKYEGYTWKAALDAHALEKPPAPGSTVGKP